MLQRDASLSQRDLAEKVGLSQNACWRRLKSLEERGVIRGRTLQVDRNKLGLGLVVFVMVKTAPSLHDLAADLPSACLQHSRDRRLLPHRRATMITCCVS